MIHSQDCKYVFVTPPAALLDNASAATTAIDTKGYDRCEIICGVGATDIAMTALKVQTSDTDGSYADKTGLVYGTSTLIDGTTSALPGATDDNKLYVFDIDCKNVKRFLDLVATFGDGVTGGYFTAVARLSRGAEAAVSMAERGAAGVLRV